MRALLLAGVSALMITLSGVTMAQQQNSSGKEVTGTVTSVDKQGGQIVVDGQTYQLSQGGGAGGGAATMMPAAGDKISFFYKDEGGKKVITRIGQAQQ
jgi:hypothetical protein